MTRGGGSIISHIVLRSSGGSLENLWNVGPTISSSPRGWSSSLIALVVTTLFVTDILDFLVLVVLDSKFVGDVFPSSMRGRRRIWDAPCDRLVGSAIPLAAPAREAGFADAAMERSCRYVSRGFRQVKESLGSRYLWKRVVLLVSW